VTRLASLVSSVAGGARRCRGSLVAGLVVARRRLAVIVVLVVLVVAGVVVRDLRATVEATDQARTDTVEARTTLAQTDDDLDAALDALAVDDEILATEAAALSARQAERAEAQGTFDATQLWLAALQAQLAAATTELEASTGRLTALQTCLAGAAEALNQAAARDTAGSAATIRGIEGSCAEAGVAL
jgi:chromosome segregation ATPase